MSQSVLNIFKTHIMLVSSSLVLFQADPYNTIVSEFCKHEFSSLTMLLSVNSKTKSILLVNLTQWPMSALLTTLLSMSSKTKSISSPKLTQWQMSATLTTLLSMSSKIKSLSSVNLTKWQMSALLTTLLSMSSKSK